MRRELALDPVQDVLSSIASNFVGSSFSSEEMKAKLVTVIGSNRVGRLLRAISENRITVCSYELFTKLDSAETKQLMRMLRNEIADIRKLSASRDDLLRKLCALLEENEVTYVVFKTINKSGAVGVDLDVMIKYCDFDRTTNLLLNAGFRAIDDLSKKYATGFMFKDNPIIIDLHTELAVLGVRYLSSTSILSSKKRIALQSSYDNEPLELNIPNEVMEAIVRMSHSVIKEASITLADIIEPVEALNKEPHAIAEWANRTSLQTAVTAFVRIAAARAGGVYLENSSLFHNAIVDPVARAMIAQASNSPKLPVRLSRILSVDAMLSRLKGQNEMTQYLPLLISSMKFKRNVEHLSRKMLRF